MPNKLNLAGKKINRLLIIKEVGKDQRGGILWECICDCENKVIVRSDSISNGHAKSCGCIQKEKAKNGCIKRLTTHGQANTPEYNVWSHLKSRCLNKSDRAYKNYGGRGIKVCSRWLKFENFIKDIGNRPNKSLTVERINNDGNYEPSNCKWATRTEQALNTRRNKKCVMS